MAFFQEVLIGELLFQVVDFIIQVDLVFIRPAFGAFFLVNILLPEIHLNLDFAVGLPILQQFFVGILVEDLYEGPLDPVLHVLELGAYFEPVQDTTVLFAKLPVFHFGILFAQLVDGLLDLCVNTVLYVALPLVLGQRRHDAPVNPKLLAEGINPCRGVGEVPPRQHRHKSLKVVGYCFY